MQNRRYTSLWIVLGLLTAANFFHYANRNVVITMYDELRTLFAFSNSDLGLLNTAFMVTHAPATLFLGWLSDRVERKHILVVGLLVWSSAAVLSALTANIIHLLAARAIVGLGTAACVPVANALICDYVADGRKAMAISVFNVGLFLGGAVGALIGKAAGFPLAFVIVGAPGVGLALMLAVVRLAPSKTMSPLAKTAAQTSKREQLRILLKIPTYRWTVVGAILMAFAAGGYIAWFFDFLEGDKGASEAEAGFIFGVSLVTGLFGVLAGGFVADRLKRRVVYGRQAAVAIGMGLSVPLALLVIYLPLGLPFTLVSWILMFTISWYHAPIAASVDDLVPSQMSGLAQGLYIAAMHLFGTAPSSWLVGALKDRVGLQTALLLPTAALLVAVLCFVASFRTVGRVSRSKA